MSARGKDEAYEKGMHQAQVAHGTKLQSMIAEAKVKEDTVRLALALPKYRKSEATIGVVEAEVLATAEELVADAKIIHAYLAEGFGGLDIEMPDIPKGSLLSL
jgi:hypothetical protein